MKRRRQKKPFFTFRKRKSHLGVVLDDRGIRFAEVQTNSQTVRVKNLGDVKLEEGLIHDGRIMGEEKIALQLALSLKEINYRTKKAILSLPSSAIVVRKISLPKMRSKEIRPLLSIELETTIHLPFSRPYFDFYKLKGTDARLGEEEDAQEEYLVVAAPGDLIESYFHLFKQVGIEVKAIDIEPLALYRLLYRQNLLPEEDNYMFLQIGMESVDVSFFEGETPEFIRNIPLDWSSYNTQSGSQMQSPIQSFAEDLLRELERIINFYQFNVKGGEKLISALYITGSFPVLSEIVYFVKERLANLSVSLLPIEHIVQPSSYEKVIHAYTVPIGLSMKG
jgi:type IV pilus assembly protein PilM